MSRDEQTSGISGVLFGEHWHTGAWRAAVVFILAYVLPTMLMTATSRPAAVLRFLGTVCAFVFTAGAIYRLLQSRNAEEWTGDDATILEMPPAVPVRAGVKTPGASASPVVATEAAGPAPASAPLALENLGQAALERLCMALYQFNGLNSRTLATGAEGEYRIRLVPRNTEKAIALLRCQAGSEPQGVVPYMALLRMMEEEGLEKAFFVAPAGFVHEVSAQARQRHVTLVDLKLLHAMIERLPESARAVVFDAAH